VKWGEVKRREGRKERRKVRRAEGGKEGRKKTSYLI